MAGHLATLRSFQGTAQRLGGPADPRESAVGRELSCPAGGHPWAACRQGLAGAAAGLLLFESYPLCSGNARAVGSSRGEIGQRGSVIARKLVPCCDVGASSVGIPFRRHAAIFNVCRLQCLSAGTGAAVHCCPGVVSKTSGSPARGSRTRMVNLPAINSSSCLPTTSARHPCASVGASWGESFN